VISFCRVQAEFRPALFLAAIGHSHWVFRDDQLARRAIFGLRNPQLDHAIVGQGMSVPAQAARRVFLFSPFEFQPRDFLIGDDKEFADRRRGPNTGSWPSGGSHRFAACGIWSAAPQDRCADLSQKERVQATFGCLAQRCKCIPGGRVPHSRPTADPRAEMSAGYLGSNQAADGGNRVPLRDFGEMRRPRVRRNEPAVHMGKLFSATGQLPPACQETAVVIARRFHRYLMGG